MRRLAKKVGISDTTIAYCASSYVDGQRDGKLIADVVQRRIEGEADITNLHLHVRWVSARFC